MLSILGLVIGLALLIGLTIRGFNLFIVAPICATLVAITNNISLLSGDANAVTYYMDGFSGFVASWFFMFLLGAIFGKLMEDSGAADSLAHWVVKRFGASKAILAVVAACALMTYGGVSLFVVAFSVYPMAVALFKDANLPRRFIPAALGFGSVTFTMTSAGSPEIQNWIPIKYLGTSPFAAWEVSLVVAILMATFGYMWLTRMVNKAVANGEQFSVRANDPSFDSTKPLPSPISALIPLLVVLVVSFLFHDEYAQYALILALGAGVICLYLINRQYITVPDETLNAGTISALIAIGNTAAVVGFGAVAKQTDGFAETVALMTNLPGNELIGAAVAVSVIAGLTGSASGGQAIALPLIGPHYLEQGVQPEQLHRVVAISSGALDSLPHNGYVVTTIRAICGETHRAAYLPMAAMTVVTPLLGLCVAIGLFIML